MINKLIFAHELILKPYEASAGGADKNTGLHRIKELQTLLMQNTEHKETLTRLMAQGCKCIFKLVLSLSKRN